MSNPIDLRLLLGPLAAIASARSLAKTIPATVVQPPPDMEDAEPIPVPARMVIGPDPTDLPDELLTPDGQPDTVKMVGVLWGAVWQLMTREQMIATGRATVTGGIWIAGSTHEIAVPWDTAPLALPEGGVVTVQPALAALGRTTARVKPGSITTSGCIVIATALSAVTLSVANPITYEVQAPYDYYPNPETS